MICAPPTPANATNSSPAHPPRSTAVAAPTGCSTAEHASSSARNSGITASTWSAPTLAVSAAPEAAHETLGRYGIVPHRRAQGRPRHPATAPQPGAADPGGDPATLAARQSQVLAAQASAVVYA